MRRGTENGLAPKVTPFDGVEADSGEPAAGAEPVSVQPVDIEAEVGSALPSTGSSDEGKLSEIGRDQLILLQKQDPTLAPVRAKVALRPPKEKTGYFFGCWCDTATMLLNQIRR